jgi:hypothetical protein
MCATGEIFAIFLCFLWPEKQNASVPKMHLYPLETLGNAQAVYGNDMALKSRG